MTLTVELERELDGRWIAEIRELSGVLAYGATLFNLAHEQAQRGAAFLLIGETDCDRRGAVIELTGT